MDWNAEPWTDAHPTEKEMAGKPLADGLFAVLLCLKGDLDYFAKALHLRHYNANEMCDMCPAHRISDDPDGLYNIFFC